MNVDAILSAMNSAGVNYLLIGGMNFMLRHKPVLTYDVDLLIEDTQENRLNCESALTNLQAEWGVTDEDWGPVAERASGWLDRQGIYCLNCPDGAVDIMRWVPGIDDWSAVWQRSVVERTKSGVAYRGLSDEDMLRCQLALGESHRKADRVRYLQSILDGER
ncbi:MAG: hypothetical protein AAGF31_12810 [Planctomycetota bacterium]